MSAASPNGHRPAPSDGRWLTPPPIDDGSAVWSDDRYAAGARDGVSAAYGAGEYAAYGAPTVPVAPTPSYAATYTSPHHANYHANYGSNYGTNIASPQSLPPYWPQPRGLRPPVDGFAIASLIFGLIGGFIFSIGFGVAALRRIAQGRRRGRPLAIIGLTLSAAWVLAYAIGYVIISRR